MRPKGQIPYNLQMNKLAVSFVVYTCNRILFLISNFRLVLNVVFSLLVDFPVSEFYFSDVLKYSVNSIF
jgi:hypothetical protein